MDPLRRPAFIKSVTAAGLRGGNTSSITIRSVG
jgi:hypothetical protein